MNLLWGQCPLVAAMYKINDIVRLDLMKKNYQTPIAEEVKAKLLQECFRVSLRSPQALNRKSSWGVKLLGGAAIQLSLLIQLWSEDLVEVSQIRL